ncbi:MAG: hypothetical protein R3A80_00805 [Bdellovibrionota bacterium]
MADKQFSWLTEATLEPLKIEEIEKKNPLSLDQFKERILFHKKTLLGVGLLLAVLFVLKVTQREQPMAPYRLEAMAAVLPIPKGQIIEGMLLRPIKITPSSVSKNQKMQLLRPVDAEDIMGKIRAKKDIPPHKPIFWSEVELNPKNVAPTKKTIPAVTYPED